MKYNKQVVRSFFGLLIGIALLSHIAYTIASNDTITSASFGQFIGQTTGVFYLVIILLFISSSIEIIKWKQLLDSQNPVSWKQATMSVMLGQAASFITPNRIGDYPARILSLKSKLTYGSISLSIMGATAQTLAVLFCSQIALLKIVQNNLGSIFELLFVINTFILIVITVLYFKLEWLSIKLSNIKYLRKIKQYINVMRTIPRKLYFSTIIWSILKCLIYTLQLFLLVRSAKMQGDQIQIFLICIIYFWGMTIIPSIAYAELGIRNKWGLFLFSCIAFESWKIAIAITSLWLINIVIPAIIGATLFLIKKPNNKIYASSY